MIHLRQNYQKTLIEVWWPPYSFMPHILLQWALHTISHTYNQVMACALYHRQHLAIAVGWKHTTTDW